MSRLGEDEPDCGGAETSPLIDLVITPKAHDIGGLVVRRTLPNRSRRSVGPFVFLDQMGPAVYAPGEGLDVRPHPHIGLATITENHWAEFTGGVGPDRSFRGTKRQAPEYSPDPGR